ncbi:MAG TPA: HAD hydrolase family protein [Pyrinomonadaceae bacterium]
MLDCDGVLTDGRLYYSVDGERLKVFDVQDGLGIVNWIQSGSLVGVISGRSSDILGRRATELGIQIVYQGVKEKTEAAREIFVKTGIAPEETAFIGDDLPDIELMRWVGVGVAVANAADEVKAAADHVTTRTGGCGAVRETIDILLAARNLALTR